MVTSGVSGAARPAGGVVWLGVVAALLYSSWLFGWAANPDHDPLTGYVSELAALGEPFARTFRSFDGIAGATVVIACIIVLARSRAPRRHLVTFALLTVFGLATITDALAPLSCTPTSDMACAAAEKARDVPLHHLIHEATSSIAGVAATAAMLWWWLVEHRRLRRAGDPGEKTLYRIGVVLVVVHTAALVISLADIAGIGFGVLGAAQRISLLALALWLPVPFLRHAPDRAQG